MRKQIFLIQVLEGLNSSILQKMSSPQNMLLTDNIVNAKLFDSSEQAQQFIYGLEKTYENNNLIKFNIINAVMEVAL